MSSQMPIQQINRSTFLGLVAILLWSTTIAFSRSLTEQLGTFTAAALIYCLAGAFGLLYTAFFGGGLRHILSLPKLYLFGCGGLFVAYMVCLYLSIGLAATRTQVLAIGLINYLWPGLSLLFAIPILGRKAKPLLPVGIIVALVGIWLATGNGSDITITTMFQDNSAWLPYSLAFCAAICWGLYSNLSRRWAAGNDSGAVPLFLTASGLVLGIMRLFTPEKANWTIGAGLELLYMALFPAMLAYVFWDIAVRKGEIILVASLSYLTPLLSTLVSVIVLRVEPGAALWFGALLVMSGALLCKASLSNPP